MADHSKFKIGVTGDSQTDLCAPNAETHAGVLERELDADGADVMVLPYGVGRYSPLQDYLVFKKVLKPYTPDALIVNFYTGNDFNDLLRVDDRPHFVDVDGHYEIAGPTWYRYQDPHVDSGAACFSCCDRCSTPPACGTCSCDFGFSMTSRPSRALASGRSSGT